MTRTRFARWLRWGALSTLLVLLAALPAPPPLSASPQPTPRPQPAAQGSPSLPPGLAPILARALARDGERTYAPAPLPGRADAFAATNPAQHLTTTFLPAGLTLTTSDRAGGTTWGMRLAALGRGSHLVPLPATLPVLVGQRVAYRRGGVTEWYLNSPLGLEQGMTLAASPVEQGSGALVLTVAVTGARIVTSGTEGLLLVLPGGERLRYGDLVVTDARGQEVPARLVTAGGEIRIVVDDRGAVYPLVVDPLVQQARLTADDGAARDTFGQSVTVSSDGSTALIGAYNKKIGANSQQGAAYVFTRTGTTWSPQARLTASDGAAGDAFGISVAMSGDGSTALIGAPSKTIGANSGQGAAYLYTRTGTMWSQQQELTASDGAANDLFGISVAMSGDGSTALVGAVYKTIGTNSQQGAAYLFTRGGTTWSQQAELTANDGAAIDQFGISVAMSGDGSIALVGARDKTIGGNSLQGAAYVFTRTGTAWSQQPRLTASDGADGDRFGYAVALSGDGSTALVGAYNKAIGANRQQGAAYVFTRTGTVWSQQQELTASDGAASDDFGTSVALSGDGSIALVGADSKTIGTNSGQGAAYVYLQVKTNPLPPPQPTATVVPMRPRPLPVMHPTAVPILNPTPLPLPPRRP